MHPPPPSATVPPSASAGASRSDTNRSTLMLSLPLSIALCTSTSSPSPCLHSQTRSPCEPRFTFRTRGPAAMDLLSATCRSSALLCTAQSDRPIASFPRLATDCFAPVNNHTTTSRKGPRMAKPRAIWSALTKLAERIRVRHHCLPLRQHFPEHRLKLRRPFTSKHRSVARTHAQDDPCQHMQLSSGPKRALGQGGEQCAAHHRPVRRRR